MAWLKAAAVGALGSLIIFIVMTLVLHIIYGALNGWLIPLWGGHDAPKQASA